MGPIWILLDSSGMGGIESHVAELAAGLVEAGERAHVLFLRDHGPHPLRERLRREYVSWECLPGDLLGLLVRLRAGRPAVLHTHGYKSGLLGRFAARLAGIPCVSTFHAGERARGRVAIYDALDRWTSLLSSKRLAVSRPILDRLPWSGELVANFVAIPPRLPLDVPPDVVAFVGRFAHEKGPDIFCKLPLFTQGLRYEAFGDGPLRAQCENLAGGRVVFRGAVSCMDEAWAGIGLLAVTSRAEGLPLAALEALAHGVPIAAFAVGGLPEAIEDGVDGFLVRAGDIAALAEKVSQWQAMPRGRRAVMARAAHAKAARSFGRPGGIARLRAIYAAARDPQIAAAPRAAA